MYEVFHKKFALFQAIFKYKLIDCIYLKSDCTSYKTTEQMNYKQMKVTYLFIFLSTILIATSCSSGKKALENGEYYKAIIQATNRLRQKPDHKKSITTLKEGYPLAISYYKGLIDNEKAGTYKYKWNNIVGYMFTVNNMYDEIQRCPACLKTIKTPVHYTEEMNQARRLAAEECYYEAEKLLQTGNRLDALDAYYLFVKADKHIADYKDVKQKILEAEWLATLKITLEKIPSRKPKFRSSINRFNENVIFFLSNECSKKKFVSFFGPLELEQDSIHPDQIVMVSFEDIFMGPLKRGNKELIVKSKDSVKVNEKTVNGKKIPVYDYVTAKLEISQKSILVKSLCVLKIVDAYTGDLIYIEKFPEHYEWINEWARFSGDERALSAQDLQLVKNKEVYPPSTQQLFDDSVQPTLDKVKTSLKKFYSKY